MYALWWNSQKYLLKCDTILCIHRKMLCQFKSILHKSKWTNGHICIWHWLSWSYYRLDALFDAIFNNAYIACPSNVGITILQWRILLCLTIETPSSFVYTRENCQILHATQICIAYNDWISNFIAGDTKRQGTNERS